MAKIHVIRQILSKDLFAASLPPESWLPAPITADDQRNILISCFQGYNRDETAQRINLGEGTVSRFLREFDNQCRTHGLIPTSEAYDVAQIVAPLNQLARTLREKGKSVEEAIRGATLVSNLERLDVDLPDLEGFVSELYMECRDRNLNVKKLREYGVTLQQLKSEYGMDFDEVKEAYESLGPKVKLMKTELATFKTDIATARKEYRNMLKLNKITEEDLTAFTDLRKELRKSHFDISDLQATLQILKNLEEEGFKEEIVAEKLKTIEGMESTFERTRRDLEELKTRRETEEKNLKSVTTTLEPKQKLLDKVGLIESMGFNPQILQTIRDIVVQKASAYGYSRNEAMENLQTDLNTYYDTLLGFQPEFNRLKAERQQLEEEISTARRELLELDIKYTSKKTEISNYASLREKNVTDAQISRWNKILEECKLEPSVFEAELKQFSGLKKLIEKEELNMNRLNTARDRLNGEVESLEKHRDTITSSLKAIRNAGTDVIQNASKEALQKVDDSARQIQTIVSSTLTETQESLSLMKREATATSEQVSGKMKEMVTTMQDLTIQALDTGKKLAGYPEIMGILRVYNRKPQDALEFYTIHMDLVGSLLEGIKTQPPKKSFRLKDATLALLEELRKEVGG